MSVIKSTFNTNLASNSSSSTFDNTAILSLTNATQSTANNNGSLTTVGGIGCIGNLNVGGVFNSLQSSDTITSLTYNTNLALTMNTYGMVYYITGGTPSLVTNLSISAIPVTATGVLASYVFTIIYFTSSPYYYTAGGTSMSLTLTNAYNTTITPITSGGTVNLPTSYSYIMQTITLINKIGGSAPTFVAFNNVQGF